MGAYSLDKKPQNFSLRFAVSCLLMGLMLGLLYLGFNWPHTVGPLGSLILMFLVMINVCIVRPRSTRRPFSNRPDKVLLIVGACGIAGTIIYLEMTGVLSIDTVGHVLKPLFANPFFLFFIWLIAISAEWKRFYC
jgi:hypothetical protein